MQFSTFFTIASAMLLLSVGSLAQDTTAVGPSAGCNGKHQGDACSFYAGQNKTGPPRQGTCQSSNSGLLCDSHSA